MQTSTIDLSLHSQMYLDHLKKMEKSFNTIKNYRTDLNTFAKFLSSRGHNGNIQELSTTMLKEYSRFLEKTYTSSNSIRRRVQALRLFFDWLITNNFYDSNNPIKKILSSPKRVDDPAPVPFADVKKAYSFLSESITLSNSSLEKLISARNMLLFHLIYGTGLKVSNIEGLKVSSILPGSKFRVLIAHPKRDLYTVPLCHNFELFFSDYLKLLEEQKNKDQVFFQALLFNANHYKILKGDLSARGIELFFKDLSKKLDLEITAKKLRQSCVFKWINQGHPDSQIKDWMGVRPQYSLIPFKTMLDEQSEHQLFQEISADSISH